MNLSWKNLLGDPSAFSMESRVLHAVSVLTLATLVLLVPFNFIIGLWHIAFMLLACILLQAWVYYLSRYAKRFRLAAGIYFTVIYCFLIFNYYFNSGIKGPTLMTFIVSFVLFIALTPSRRHPFWVALHLVLPLLLLVLDYYNVGIKDTYQTRLDQFIDNAVSYIVLLISMYFIMRYIRANYYREKRLAGEYAASLEELNRERNRLFSIISHDLRVPLNSIQGYLKILADSPLGEDERQHIERQLLEQTNQTQDLLFNLLSWSKSQLAGNEPALRVLDVNGSLAGTFRLFNAMAEKKNISTVYQIHAGVQVLADEAMLQVIARNLLHNAIKFTPPGGRITISAYNQGNECFISVEDTGYGIPPGKQADVFTSRIKSSPGTRKEKGTGLGLLVCREFTEQQSGRIWFSTTEGKGTGFFLSLPSGL